MLSFAHMTRVGRRLQPNTGITLRSPPWHSHG